MEQKEIPKRLQPTAETLKMLLLRSGNQCAFPGCTEVLYDSNNQLQAECCHIEAALSGGERYNEKSTNEERRSESNLMFLCRNHHKKTNDVDKFPVAKLKAIKADHESKFTGGIGWSDTQSIDRSVDILIEFYEIINQKKRRSRNTRSLMITTLVIVFISFLLTHYSIDFSPINANGDTRIKLPEETLLIIDSDKKNDNEPLVERPTSPKRYFSISSELTVVSLLSAIETLSDFQYSSDASDLFTIYYTNSIIPLEQLNGRYYAEAGYLIIESSNPNCVGLEFPLRGTDRIGNTKANVIRRLKTKANNILEEHQSEIVEEVIHCMEYSLKYQTE